MWARARARVRGGGRVCVFRSSSLGDSSGEVSLFGNGAGYRPYPSPPALHAGESSEEDGGDHEEGAAMEAEQDMDVEDESFHSFEGHAGSWW